MKKFLLKPALALLFFAASIIACKQSNSTLQPSSYINASNSVTGVDLLSKFRSFSSYDLIYFLITSKGVSVYVSER